VIHQLAEQGRFAEIDMTTTAGLLDDQRRAAPDTPQDLFPAAAPAFTQPSADGAAEGPDARLIGADQSQHPFTSTATTPTSSRATAGGWHTHAP